MSTYALGLEVDYAQSQREVETESSRAPEWLSWHEHHPNVASVQPCTCIPESFMATHGMSRRCCTDADSYPTPDDAEPKAEDEFGNLLKSSPVGKRDYLTRRCFGKQVLLFSVRVKATLDESETMFTKTRNSHLWRRMASPVSYGRVCHNISNHMGQSPTEGRNTVQNMSCRAQICDTKWSSPLRKQSAYSLSNLGWRYAAAFS